MFIKKGRFLYFEWVKWKFHHFDSPWKNMFGYIWQNTLLPLLEIILSTPMVWREAGHSQQWVVYKLWIWVIQTQESWNNGQRGAQREGVSAITSWLLHFRVSPIRQLCGIYSFFPCIWDFALIPGKHVLIQNLSSSDDASIRGNEVAFTS